MDLLPVANKAPGKNTPNLRKIGWMSENEETRKDEVIGTILIVENHKTVRNSLKDWLGAIFQDCRFLEAESGEKAIELACAEEPNIILMDIGLPGINGIEATHRIKTVLPRTKVIMLSVYESSHYMTEAAKAGADAYVNKREMGRRLVDTIRKFLPFPTGQTSQ